MRLCEFASSEKEYGSNRWGNKEPYIAPAAYMHQLSPFIARIREDGQDEEI